MGLSRITFNVLRLLVGNLPLPCTSMGNANYRQTTGNQYLTVDQRNYFQTDLPKFIYQSKIGNGKFMKTYIMRVDSAPVVVKVYMKLSDEDLLVPAANLTFIWKTLSPAKYPNLLPYQVWIKSASSARIKSPASPVYLIRQYFSANLYDRLSTRPFLNEVEKLWVVFQLFKCLEICHEHGVVHGDLKPENIMCTTSNWIVLTDFSPFKPATIPDDDPTDFQYYFDCMGRHRCYLAPERFYHKSVGTTVPSTDGSQAETSASSVAENFRSRLGSRFGAGRRQGTNQQQQQQQQQQQPPAQSGFRSSALTPAMDVFSLGCLAAEVLLDGVPLLDLPGMLRYLSMDAGASTGAVAEGSAGAAKVPLSRLDQEDSPARALLMRISNVHLRNVIADMTQRDPAARLSVSEYLDILEGKIPGLDAASISASAAPPPVPQPASASGAPLPPPPPPASPLYVFPSYFDSSLYPLFLKMHWNGVTPDERVNLICQSYGDLLSGIGGPDDAPGCAFFLSALSKSGSSRGGSATVLLAADPTALFKKDKEQQGGGAASLPASAATPKPSAGADSKRRSTGAFLRQHLKGEPISSEDQVPRNPHAAALLAEDPSLCDTEELLAVASALIADLEKGWETAQPTAFVQTTGSAAHKGSAQAEVAKFADEDIMRHATADVGAQIAASTGLRVSMSWGGVPVHPSSRTICEGAVVLIDILHANYRHLRYPRSKLVCLLLFSRLGRLCTDAVILERILPLLLVTLEDQCAAVRAMAVRTMRALLVLVRDFGVAESNIFPLYIFPSLTRISKDQEPCVRVAFAESVASFAEAARRALDLSHATCVAKTVAGDANSAEACTEPAGAQEEGASGVNVLFPYDRRLDQLKEQVSRWIRDLIVDVGPAAAGQNRASAVKRLLLTDITRLCVFFGQESAVDRVLTQLFTFLDDPDWELRHAFCAKIPAVCAFLGRTVTAECILPFVENAVYDVEEKVVLSAMHALTTILQARLISNRFAIDFVEKSKCLLLHPNSTLAEAAAEFVSAAAAVLGPVDTEVFLLPQLTPMLKYDLSGCPITADVLRCAAVERLTRPAYRRALLRTLSEISTTYQQLLQKEAAAGKVDASSLQDHGQGSDGDEQKVLALQPYLREAARNINAKALNARGTASSKAPGLPAAISAEGPSSSVFSLLDLTATTLPEHSLQSILVPHQKYGSFLYRALPEDQRCSTTYMDVDSQRTSNKLRALYGVTVRQGDSARALAVGTGQWDAQGQDVSLFGGAEGAVPTQSSHAGPIGALADASSVLRRIKALDVPPLPLDVGHLMQPTQDNRTYSSYTEPLDISCSLDGASRSAWRPKEGVLLTTLKEHSGAVNRLVISPDQAFFASASADRTVKIWQTRQLDRVAFPRSAATYDLHKGEVLDAVPIENSHSIATASADGTVHVWRVDLQGSGVAGPGSAADISDEYSSSMTGITVKDKSQLRVLDPAEGAVLCVNHFNSDVCSIVTYATQRGGLHGWDLRAAREVMRLPVRPELGYTTSMTMSPDRNWVCMGTSKGFVTLFDIRYNVPSKLWRHSSHGAIHRLACCKAPRVAVNAPGANVAVPPQSEGAFLFVAAGKNEAAVWGIPEGGECCKCFRSMSLDVSRGPIAPLPFLEEVALPRHPHAPVRFEEGGSAGKSVGEDSVRAIIGRISQSNMSYLVTAGTDRSIRFWDFSAANRCFTVSGLEAAQPKAIFDAPKLADGSSGKLFVCYVAATPSADKILQMHLPAREGRGIVLPSVNAKDAILDLKNIDLPMKLMLSSSRDGEIKLWR